MKKVTKIIQNQKILFWSLLLVLMVFVFTYFYLINQTIVNTAERSHAQRAFSALSEEASSLEFQYINLKSGIDMEKAKSFGFNSAEPYFISRRSLGQAVTQNPIR